MKNLILLVTVCIIFFAACGRGEPESFDVSDADVSDALEIEESVERYTHEPPPSQEIPAPMPSPSAETSPPPEPTPAPHIYYESGLLGVKFRVDNLPIWNLPEWSPFQTENRANTNQTLLGRRTDIYGDVEFGIMELTAHPRTWQGRYYRPSYHTWTRVLWRQPDEPTEVFITDTGLTVVKYTHTTDHERHMHIGDFNMALFLFRRDGRDYREVSGTQILYVAKLSAPTQEFEALYEDARAVINSLQFLDGAEISTAPTDTAHSIGITAANFPRIDGSTSTIQLTQRIISAMYHPIRHEHGEHFWYSMQRYEPITSSRTIPSYELLISGEVDMILVPDPSGYVMELAANAGVELEFIPIALEALVFITASHNPVSEITLEQIRQIYTEMSITNWAEIGGNDAEIIPFHRNIHSGSHTLMENMVLHGRGIHPDIWSLQIGEMGGMLREVAREVNGEFHWYYLEGISPYYYGLGYTVYFFLQSDDGYNAGLLKTLAVDGVAPSHETILSGEYPLSTSYFAVIRADTPEDAPARKIINWLLTPEGQNVVEAAGLGRIYF